MRRGLAVLLLAACGGNGGRADNDAASLDAALVDDAAPGAVDSALADAAPPPLSRLLFLADQDQDGVVELYLAALTDHLVSVVKVNTDTGGRSIRSYAWSPTGDHVFYGVQSTTQGGSQSELYVVPVAGGEPGPPVRVAIDLPTSDDQVIGEIALARWSPDGSRIAFIADHDFGVYQLYTVEVGHEEAPVELPGLARPDFDVLDFAWSPDGSALVYRVFYRPTPDEEDMHGLWLAPAAGGPAAEVSDLPPSGEVVELSSWEEGYAWSPDGMRLFYRADQDIDNLTDVYVADLAGGVPSPAVRVSAEVTSGQPGVIEADWSPDGTHLAFLADRRDAPPHLYTIDFSGGSAGPPVVASESIAAARFLVWSPDARWLAFNGTAGGPMALFAADVAAGGEPVQVDVSRPGRMANIGNPSCFPTVWSRDSSLLGFLTSDSSGHAEAWAADFSGGSPSAVRMNADLVANGSLLCPLRWSPVEPALLYVADQEERLRFELFAVEAASPGSSLKVNDALAFEGDVQDVYNSQLDFDFSRAGDWIAYRADQEVNERVELYAVRRSALADSVRVSSVVPLGDVLAYEWAP